MFAVAIFYRMTHETKMLPGERDNAIQGCSPKKTWGRLKQDLDEDLKTL